MPSILDKSFRYVSAAKTDIRKTIARELRRLAAEKQALAQAKLKAEAEARAVQDEQARKVRKIGRKA